MYYISKQDYGFWQCLHKHVDHWLGLGLTMFDGTQRWKLQSEHSPGNSARNLECRIFNAWYLYRISSPLTSGHTVDMSSRCMKCSTFFWRWHFSSEGAVIFLLIFSPISDLNLPLKFSVAEVDNERRTFFFDPGLIIAHMVWATLDSGDDDWDYAIIWLDK